MIVQLPAHDTPSMLQKRRIANKCPVCGGPRGNTIYVRKHWQGNRLIVCEWWDNPCGHAEDLQALQQEGVRMADDVPTDFDRIVHNAVNEILNQQKTYIPHGI